MPHTIETPRLNVRPYLPCDGAWNYAMSLRTRAHLSRDDSGNVVMSINSEEEAERVVRDLEQEWRARGNMFLGAFA